MAVCDYYVRTSFFDITPPAGGIWTYVGYSSSAAGGPFTDTPANPLLIGYSEGDTIPLGDDFQLVPESKTAGFYKFQYNVSGGTYNLVVQVVTDTDCAGDDGSMLVSSSDGTGYDIETLITSVDCPTLCSSGTWVDNDSAGAAFSGSTFTPSTVGSDGTYTFTYKCQDSTFEALECADCNIESTFAFEVTSDFRAYLTTADATCTYEASIQHPLLGTSNIVTVDIEDDAIHPTFCYRKLVQASSGSDICEGLRDCTVTLEQQHPDTLTADQIKLTVSPDDTYPGHSMDLVVKQCGEEIYRRNTEDFANAALTFGVSLSGLETGGYIDQIRLTVTDGGVESNIDVPCGPAGASSVATKTGSAGTVTDADLTFDDSDAATFGTALSTVIKNHLIDDLSYTEGLSDDFLIALSSSSYTVTGLYDLTFRVKHQPTATWIGLKEGTRQIVANLDGVIGETTYTDVDSELSESSAFNALNYTESVSVANMGLSSCGLSSLDVSNGTTPTLVDLSTMDYNSFELNCGASELINCTSSVATYNVAQDGTTSTNCTDEYVVNEMICDSSGQVVLDASNSQRLYTGGTFNSLSLKAASDGSTIVVPLDPTTATLTETCTQCSTVTASNLTYNELNGHEFAASIRIAIINYLYSQGYTYGTDYSLLYSTWDVDNDAINIGFVCKHNPTSEWVGIDLNNSALSFDDGNPGGSTTWVTVNNSLVGSKRFISWVYSNTPCPSSTNRLKFTTNAISNSIYLDEVNTTYNFISVASATQTYTINSGASNLDHDCDSTTLTTNTINCGGTVTYVWNTGDTNQSIVRVNGTGFYEVTASCDSPVEDSTANKTI